MKKVNIKFSHEGKGGVIELVLKQGIPESAFIRWSGVGVELSALNGQLYDVVEKAIDQYISNTL